MSDRLSGDPRLQQVLDFPLVGGILGRRSRRFGYGMSIPSGPLAYTSRHEPLPLSEMVVSRCAIRRYYCVFTRKHSTSNWNFTTSFSSQEPTCKRMPNTWNAGTLLMHKSGGKIAL